MDLAGAGDEILAVFFAGFVEVGLEPGFGWFRERDEAMFAAFGVVNGDGGVVEVEIPDAEAKAFHEAKPGSAEALGGKPLEEGGGSGGHGKRETRSGYRKE